MVDLCMNLTSYMQASAIPWINSYLVDHKRYHKVIIEGESSRDIKVYSGVPQGIVLCLLMFNDIVKILNQRRIVYVYKTI